MNGVHHGFDCVYHMNGDGHDDETDGSHDTQRHKNEIVIECHEEYYANGDGGGDEKEEFLKYNGGDGIILNHFVGWYFFF